MVENQHKHIQGYRELTLNEIAAMNRAKQAENDLAEVVRCVANVATEAILGRASVPGEQFPSNPHDLHESARQIALARTHFEEGFMHLVRAVARPVSPWVPTSPPAPQAGGAGESGEAGV